MPTREKHLLHFVHHRPKPGVPRARACFPMGIDEVMSAAHGDYIQQLGIAGTNVVPGVLSWRAWLANERLARLFQPSDLPSWPARFGCGTIVHDCGTTLLVDYGRELGGLREHLAGHGCYTRQKWLLFHVEEVVRQFYGS